MDNMPPPWDPQNMIPVYEWIYRNPIPVHGLYGSHTNRDPQFLEFLRQNLSPGARVLDASCGRGHLARACRTAGYEVEGTEISAWLIKTELRDLKVHCLTYADLDKLPEKSFDAVLSNDVLEHLPNGEQAWQAMVSLTRLSRHYVIMSVGLKHRAWKYPLALGYGKRDLHLFCPGFRWWARKARELWNLQSERVYPGNYFAAGEVKNGR